MKKFFSSYIILFLICFFTMVVTIPANSQSWGTTAKPDGGGGFFGGGNNTQVIVNKDRLKEDEKKSSTTSKPEEKEALYNLDVEGISFIMPDQPVADQTLLTVTGFGSTYKFSDKMHVVAKWMQFDLDGPGDVTWTHSHMLAGIGFRDFFGDSQQWSVNILSGTSEVKGNQGIGSIDNLEMPMFLDIKYTWAFGANLLIGPQITFGRVPNSCKEQDGKFTECGHGGYSSISLSIQIGLPDSWGE